MKRYTQLLVCLIFGSFLLSGVAYAQKRGGGQGMLNPKRTLVHSAKRKGIDLKAKIEQAHVDLQEMMHRDAPDRSAVMSKVEAIGKLQISARQLRVGTMLDLRALLTPDQRKALRELMSKRRQRAERRGWRRGQGRHGPGGPGHRAPRPGGPGY